MAENAARALRSSRLGPHLTDGPACAGRSWKSPATTSLNSGAGPETMNRTVEIRTYRLKPGSGPAFHEAFIHKGIPLVKRSGMDVVAFGYLGQRPARLSFMRAFASLEDRHATEDAFYSSDGWRKGPRQSIIEHIESYQDTLIWLSPEAVERVRRDLRRGRFARLMRARACAPLLALGLVALAPPALACSADDDAGLGRAKSSRASSPPTTSVTSGACSATTPRTPSCCRPTSSR